MAIHENEEPEPAAGHRERPKLKIECKKTQCDKDKHCFLDAPKKTGRRAAMASPLLDLPPFELAAPPEPNGRNAERKCWNCGSNMIDWRRLHQRCPDDLDYTIESLGHEHVRHLMWNIKLDQWALNNAMRRGRLQMPEYAKNRLIQSVGAAVPFREGRQTGTTGDILNYAQHATATCCRKCMEVWHGVAPGREITSNDIDFFSRLLLRYVDARLPNLNPQPEHVPYIRQ